MTPKTLAKAALLFILLMSTQACSSISPPFDKMKGQPMTIYRLQNYEVAAPPAAPAPGAPASALPIPPQVAQWAAQTAQSLGLGAFIPPGMNPNAPAAAPAVANVPRFHEFRILANQAITDSGTQNDVIDVFGHESNFTDAKESCFFPEFGFAMAQPNGPVADVLVSFSCEQVKAYNFNWPYSKIGISPDTQKKLAAIIQKAFGQ